MVPISMMINMTCMRMNFTRSMMKERFREVILVDSLEAILAEVSLEVTPVADFQVEDSREAGRRQQHPHHSSRRKRKPLHLRLILAQSEGACSALRMCG